MRKLDNAAEPFLRPLVTGSFGAITKPVRRVIAQWATLRMFVLEHERSLGAKFAYAVHSQNDRSDFMNYFQIPPGIAISVAHGDGKSRWADQVAREFGARYSSSPRPGEDFDPGILTHKIQSITWGIGNLRLFIASTNDADHYRNRNWAIPYTVRLWPPDTPDFIWPPSGRTISDAYMDDLAGRLTLGRSLTGGRSLPL